MIDLSYTWNEGGADVCGGRARLKKRENGERENGERETGERRQENGRQENGKKETGDRKDGCGNLVFVFFRKEVYFVFDALAYEVW